MQSLASKRCFIVSPGFCVCIALSLLVLPFSWVFAWLSASIIHEICHYFALRLTDSDVCSISIGTLGARIEADIPSYGREVLCATAGPLGSLSLILLAKWCPKVAICGLVQAVYNLLPVFPLDGGRAVLCLVKRYIPNRLWVYTLLEKAALLMLGVLGIYCAVRLSMGIWPLIIPIILALKSYRIKTLQTQATTGTIVISEK